MGRRIRILVARGLDVLNFLKDVQNFIKDLPRVPKSVSEAKNDLQSLLDSSQKNK